VMSTTSRTGARRPGRRAPATVGTPTDGGASAGERRPAGPLTGARDDRPAADPAIIRFEAPTLHDLAEAGLREWIETNGIGGYASSTIVGLDTRRYHGLLVAALQPPVGRHVLLARLEETLVVDGERFELGTNRFPDVVHPTGHHCLIEFRLDPFPVFTYAVGGWLLTKRLCMVQGENTTLVRYDLAPRGESGGAPSSRVELELRPLLAFRDYHAMQHENGAVDGRLRITRETVALTPYAGLPTLYLAHDADSVETGGAWYRAFVRDREHERGLDDREDLFCPLTLQFDLTRRTAATLLASTDARRRVEHAGPVLEKERKRRRALADGAPAPDALVRMLTAAADHYLVRRGEQRTVIAGYHWFADWGRDTMIALPGLTLVTGRLDVARSILREFASAVDRGMLPNRFPDAGETPEYNTIDATLWYVEAVRAYLANGGSIDFVREEIYPVLADIVNWHVEGTRYGIRVDGDGLLAGGEGLAQLTWMDARIGDWVVTPRHGKPVEIQALWYNATRIVEELATRFDDGPAARRYRDLAQRCQASFEPAFWNDDAGCLADVVGAGGRDLSIRPNQIFAVSLPHGMLDRRRAMQVVDVVERRLLTPVGLRSLAVGEPGYVGRYEGDPRQRDGAYHQGTVWAWLLGPFVTAYVRAHGGTQRARRRAGEFLRPIATHLREAGLGHVSEIFDGDPPHRPAGCVAQAWSVAEILRALVEDVLDRPSIGKRGERHGAASGQRRHRSPGTDGG